MGLPSGQGVLEETPAPHGKPCAVCLGALRWGSEPCSRPFVPHGEGIVTALSEPPQNLAAARW